MAKAKATKAKAAKPAAEEKVLGAAGNVTADEHAEVKTDVKVSKKGDSIAPTGKFEVVEIEPGMFRMFNEVGQAVSPVVSKEERDDHNRPAVSKLTRQAARANALRKAREIRTPAGHNEPK